MSNDMALGKWEEIKGEIRNVWGKLSADELEKTKGNVKAIGGLIRQHYGEFKDEAEEKLNRLFGHASDKTKEWKDDLKNNPEKH